MLGFLCIVPILNSGGDFNTAIFSISSGIAIPTYCLLYRIIIIREIIYFLIKVVLVGTIETYSQEGC